jgi:glycerol-3-phosphate dehydrogenase
LIRDVARLSEREFDVLVIGGGIYGLTTAYDAAQRGLAVALVERDDFGSATSFNHLKTIHGGLRYLQSADLRRMRESIRERRTFARIAPRFVAPLRFAMPTGTSLTRNPMALKAALAIDAVVGHDRNEGVDARLHLAAGRVIAGQECRRLFDGALRTVASAAVWQDYVMVNGDRLTLSFAKAAVNHGAVLANYTEAIGPPTAGPARSSLQVRDNLTDHTFDVRARVFVNAAGPWSAAVAAAVGAEARRPLVKVMNLVTSRPARPAALVAPTRSGRALVLLPWQGRTIVGTSESPDERAADDQAARRIEVDAFIAEVNETFPSLGIRPDEVTLVHRGVVPAERTHQRLSLLGRSHVIDHPGAGPIQALSIVGVKYTTARMVAERAVDLILKKLRRPPVVCRTGDTPLPDASLNDRDSPDPIRHAISDEMAQTLVDVVVRRIGVGAAGHPGERVATECADRMQRELGWSEDRKMRELAALRNFYELTA